MEAGEVGDSQQHDFLDFKFIQGKLIVCLVMLLHELWGTIASLLVVTTGSATFCTWPVVHCFLMSC